MHSYDVRFYGDELLLDSLVKELSELVLVRHHKKGEIIYWSEGITKRSVRGIPFEESSADFDFQGTTLSDFLSYLCAKKNYLKELGADRVEVWALLEIDRHGQINGELSGDEISMLCDLKATYCWSVI